MTMSSPFQQNIALDLRQQRTLALAGVFQSTQLAHFIAYGEAVQSSSHVTHPFLLSSIQACLNIQPTAIENKNPLLYFHQLNHLNLGLQALEYAISHPFSPTPQKKLPEVKIPGMSKTQQANLPMTYAIALMQLSKKVYTNSAYQQRIQQSQQHIIKQLSFFDYNYTHPSIIGNLAQCYKDTASELKPRVLVKGKADILQNTAHADCIRAILMTGLQSAHLWRELGGTSWQFIFGKGKLLQDIRTLLKLNYQQHDLVLKD